MQTTEHWSGPEGDAYTERQTLSMESRKEMYTRALGLPWREVNSVIEFGANDGSNLKALRSISPRLILGGVEINATAYERMRKVADSSRHGSILDNIGMYFGAQGGWDMSLTRGVLIHISPDSLNKAYEALYNASRRYICITEYYSPTPRMIPYRGKDNLLWARDFAGEIMTEYPDLKLIDYFFTYHRDPQYPQDDVTTFVMEKT